jgi:predicted Fe-S protein YdhL (DUF1289 family)
MLSPCKKICKLQDNFCIGCMRTLSEIKGWSSMDEEERAKIMKEIKSRTKLNSNSSES